MSQVELKMPKMGESVAEATITKWLKKEGDKIEQDEPVLEIATDKVDSEVPSTTSGFLIKQLFKEGDVVPVGASIALIGSSQTAAPTSPVTAASSETPVIEPKVETIVATPASFSQQNTPSLAGGNKFYSPLVRNIAQQEQISQAELDAIMGTGAEGRVTKKDILNYVSNKKNGTVIKTSSPAAVSADSKPTEIATPVSTVGASDANVEIIEMDRMRKLIADHMVMSKHTSPHVTSFVEADVTNMVMWRNKVKDEFEKREKEKITFTPLFIEAIVKAIKDFPMINCSLEGSKILLKKNINIGMATALPSGNLIVPVIKNADRMNLIGLTKSVNDLSNRARKNKLLPDEIQGGTFTLTNVGTFGNVMGTPIINQPQVAIMAAGAIRKKPAVIETEFGDTIGIRHMMFLSLSYDHRIVDGSLGGSFLRKVADYLEQFDTNRNVI
jgi:2-oxoglutarate dehydrogenase E2 component (dihydrolipoamide succinyltransferase)